MTELVLADELRERELVIERGLNTFVEVGTALMEIRDQRLYREEYSNFEDYCRERWGFTRQRASQIIQGAELSRILDSPPANAGQAAELAPLMDDPEEMAEVWGEVLDEAEKTGQPVTAKRIRARVQAKRPPKQVEFTPGDPSVWEDIEPDVIAASQISSRLGYLADYTDKEWATPELGSAVAHFDEILERVIPRIQQYHNQIKEARSANISA